MRIIYILVVLIFTASCTANKQKNTNVRYPFKPYSEFKGDIIRYLDYFFENDTEKYDGGKAIVFFNNLQVMPNEYGYYEANDTTFSLLKFDFYKKNGLSDEHPKEGVYTIRIKLKKSIRMIDVEKFEAGNGKKWTERHAVFFGNLIIANKIYPSGKSFSLSSNTITNKPLTGFAGNDVQYLKSNFIDNKLKYERGALNVLLNDLELQPIDYKYVAASFDKSKSYKINLRFNQKSDTTAKKPTKPWKSTLTIEFKNPVLVADIKKLNKKYGKKWTKQHAAFFGEQRIDEISLVSSL